MPPKNDPVIAETQRVLDELNEAKAPVVGNPTPEPFAKARLDRAMQAMHEHRKLLRQVGQFVGNRPVSDDPNIPDDAVLGVRTADGEASAPTILQEA